MASDATIDEAKLQAFVDRAVADLGSALGAALVVIGDRLGLYRAMAGTGALTPAELAERTDTGERYVQDWLINQAAGAYVDYDPATGRYRLPAEHAAALCDETSRCFVGGGFELVASLPQSRSQPVGVLPIGGVSWGERGPGLAEASARFFQHDHAAHLVSTWIPALEGVATRLQSGGATVANVGCGRGAATIAMARAFPRARFFGFDPHAPSINAARRAAADAGIAARVVFDVVGASGFPGTGYDFLTYLDSLHRLADPVGAAGHAHEALAAEGTVLIVEPMAGECVEDNFNSVGRLFSALSVLCGAPRLDAGDPVMLGPLVSEKDLRDAVTAGGFTRFRRVAETSLNRVFEARP